MKSTQHLTAFLFYNSFQLISNSGDGVKNVVWTGTRDGIIRGIQSVACVIALYIYIYIYAESYIYYDTYM